MSDIIIRHSDLKDIPAIRDIYAGHNALSATLQLPYPSLKVWENRLTVLPDNIRSLVAEINHEIVGQIGFEVFTSQRRRHVGSFGMAVKDSHLGQGIGSKLLSSVIELADKWLNLRRLEITVFTANEAAINLYKKHGFEIEGESVDYAFTNGEFSNVYYMGRINK